MKIQEYVIEILLVMTLVFVGSSVISLFTSMDLLLNLSLLVSLALMLVIVVVASNKYS